MKTIAASVLALAVSAKNTTGNPLCSGQKTIKTCYDKLEFNVVDSNNKQAKACFVSGNKIQKICLKKKNFMLVKGCQDRVYNGTIDCAHAAIKLTHKVKKVKSVSKMANKAVMKILKKIGSKTRKILHVKLKINKVNKVIRKIAKINVHSSIHKTLKKIGGHTRKELRKLAEHAIRNAHALKAHVLWKQALDKVADSIVHSSDKPKAIKHKVGESRGLVRLPMLRKKTKFNFVKKLGKAIH